MERRRYKKPFLRKSLKMLSGLSLSGGRNLMLKTTLLIILKTCGKKEFVEMGGTFIL